MVREGRSTRRKQRFAEGEEPKVNHTIPRRADLLSPPPHAGGCRAGPHGLVPGAEGRRPHGSDLVEGVARLDGAVVRPGGCGNGPASGDRRRATAAAEGRAAPLGEWPGCVPHDPGGPPGLAPERNRGDRLWEQAEAAIRRVAPAQQQGQAARGVAVAARAAWTKAEAAFPQSERSEAGGERAARRGRCFVPRVRGTTAGGRARRVRWRCLSGRDVTGSREVAFPRRKRRGRSWTGSTVSCRRLHPRTSGVGNGCGSGGCVGSGRAPPLRGCLPARALWRLWCPRWSARSGTRTGRPRLARWRGCGIRRSGPAVRWSAGTACCGGPRRATGR